MLVAQPLEDALGRVLLMDRTRPVRLQDRVDTGTRAPSLGFRGGRLRTEPGGAE